MYFKLIEKMKEIENVNKIYNKKQMIEKENVK
jgi:hypothetical protein